MLAWSLLIVVMKKHGLLLSMIVTTTVITALSWHYFNSNNAGILRSKPGEVMIWLPTLLRIHIGAGMTAMAVGAGLVFSRNGRPVLHRTLGRTYALAVLVSGLAGLIVAPWALGGWVSGLGFTGLALAWLYFTGRSMLLAVRGDLPGHRRAVVFSLALTYSALTFRLFLLIPMLTDLPFFPVYRFGSWASWILQLGVAAWWLRRQTISPPAQLQLS